MNLIAGKVPRWKSPWDALVNFPVRAEPGSPLPRTGLFAMFLGHCWSCGGGASGRVPFVDGNKFVKMLKEYVDQLRVEMLSSFHLDVIINV
jgi:hypothetical protein